MFHVWRRTNDVDLASVVSVCVVCLCMAVPQVIAKDCMGPTMDLVFVVDSSRSLRPNEFQLVKQFIAEVVQGLVVSLDDVRVALVRFSTQVHVIAYLDQSTSSADVYESIKNMEYKPGGTNTYGALQKVRRDVLRPERGNRLDVPDVVVVLTDGESWHKGRTVNQALLLREQGVQVVALGIGRRAYMPELKAMTSGVVRLIKKFADLDNVVADIRQSLCSVAEKAAEEMTQNSTRSLSIRPPTATTTSPAMTTSNASRGLAFCIIIHPVL